MKQQNYSNHKMYYLPHHFVFLPFLFFLLVLGIIKSLVSEIHSFEWLLFTIVIFCILFLTLMVRQHYALGNQDRIVRLEFRLRYFELFGRSAKEVESKLSFKQVAALRFAKDDEFKFLLGKILNEGLNPEQIKRQITDWNADNMRI